MRYLLMLWFIPLFLFWSWYGLAANDINMGTVFFSREVHDAVFVIYGNTIGVDPKELPAIVAGACAFDTLIVGAIAAFRWRADWYPQVKATAIAYWNNDVETSTSTYEVRSIDPMHPAE